MQVFSKLSLAARGVLGAANLMRQRDYKERHSHLSGALKGHICEMQGQLAEYFFLGGEHHKELRVALQYFQTARGRGRGAAKQKAKKAFESLNLFLRNGQAKACKTAFDSLSDYFRPRYRPSLHEPRFCIKLVDEGKVFTFLRSKGHGSSPQLIKDAISSNSGFKYIADSGDYYFCNDIPVAATKSKYSNPRLRKEAVATYERKFAWRTKRLCSLSEPVPDNDWVNCWNADIDIGATGHAEQCYKSTLIVPMTLKRNQVSANFWNLFDSKSGGNFEKGSFGFLCFDCHEEDYFDRETDSRVAYMVADLLSLFFVLTYTFSSLSETYREAEVLNSTSYGGKS